MTKLYRQEVVTFFFWDTVSNKPSHNFVGLYLRN